MTPATTQLSGWVLIIVPIILLAQSTWLFISARERGRSGWLWGLWGLIQFPFPTIVFLLVVHKPWRFGRRNRQ